jgi:hypothetical protein
LIEIMPQTSDFVLHFAGRHRLHTTDSRPLPVLHASSAIFHPSMTPPLHFSVLPPFLTRL